MKRLLFLLILVTFANFAHAAGVCEDVFSVRERDAYEIRGERVAKRYPKMARLLADPQAYFKDISGRFEKQKAIDPARSYDFDFSDWGLSLVEDMHSQLLVKKEELASKLQEIKSSRVGTLLGRNKIADLDLTLRYFDELLVELESYQSKGVITYREVFETSYFYSRAAGLLDVSVLNLLKARDRLTLKLDQFTEGHETRTVQQEFDLYQKRNVEIFEKASPIKTWEAAAQPFRDAIFNQEKLEVLILPTMESLGPSVFMHLLNTNIFLVGVTVHPAPADGYVRPSALFFLHDLRHASFMYYRNLLYKEKHGLTSAQVDQLSRHMAQTTEELDQEIKAIGDKNLAGAIRYYLFNQHHDGGYKFAPSNYLENNAYHAPFILYVQMKLANQAHSFKSIGDIAKARKWVESFFLKRVAEEDAMIASFHAAR